LYPFNPYMEDRPVRVEVVHAVLSAMEYNCIGEQEGNFVYEHQRHPQLILLLDLSRPPTLKDILDQLDYQGENLDVFMAHLEAIEGN
jgi:hypothetical protein